MVFSILFILLAQFFSIPELQWKNYSQLPKEVQKKLRNLQSAEAKETLRTIYKGVVRYDNGRSDSALVFDELTTPDLPQDVLLVYTSDNNLVNLSWAEIREEQDIKWVVIKKWSVRGGLRESKQRFYPGLQLFIRDSA